MKIMCRHVPTPAERSYAPVCSNACQLQRCFFFQFASTFSLMVEFNERPPPHTRTTHLLDRNPAWILACTCHNLFKVLQ